MAKKKETKKTDDVQEDVAPEILKIQEEEIEEESGRKWSEEIESAGNEIAGFLKSLWNAGKNRRVIVRNQSDQTVLNMPILVGALGLFPPLTGPVIAIAAVGTGAALLKKCKISIEHREVEKEPEVA